VYTVFAPYLLSTPYSHILPPPTSTNPSGSTCSALQFSLFVKNKLWLWFITQKATVHRSKGKRHMGGILRETRHKLARILSQRNHTT
jgi:hypothetical protein